jgi:hypothetical protein
MIYIHLKVKTYLMISIDNTLCIVDLTIKLRTSHVKVRYRCCQAVFRSSYYISRRYIFCQYHAFRSDIDTKAVSWQEINRSKNVRYCVIWRFVVAISFHDMTSSVKITHFGLISTRKRFRGKKEIDRRMYAIA